MAWSGIGCLNSIVLSHWLELDQSLSKETALTIRPGTTKFAAVIAVARYSRSVEIEDTIWKAVEHSAKAVHTALRGSKVIYGINTGFGANADTRTNRHGDLQRGLIRALNYGIVSGPASNQDIRLLRAPSTSRRPSKLGPGLSTLIHTEALSLGQQHDTSMPESWVRAMVLIRAISLSKGASGIRPHIIDNVVTLLNLNMVPVVPLRGSISASGDLTCLSYLGGVLQGKSALKVMSRSAGNSQPVFLTAAEALKQANVKPVELAPKEGLAIVNGTAASAGVACLAMHEILSLSTLAQMLTAGTLEALCSTTEAFSSFLSEIRPHKGQTEVAKNILNFVTGSNLITSFEDGDGLSRQERYATRTAPQWLGPCLEDIALAYTQVVTEIDAVTDNPIINPATGKFIHGGNFQARSITSAMDKTRAACQVIGQMLFAQCTEIINPLTSHGLPSNLVVDEPNVSFMFKGTDIFIAALQSELGYLAHPTTHVQFAEQGNQAINSLALISARYTMSALDILSQMMAAQIVALCQAFDLRVMHIHFFQSFQPRFRKHSLKLLDSIGSSPAETEAILANLWKSFIKPNTCHSHMPSKQRFEEAINSLLSTLLLQAPFTSQHAITESLKWRHQCTQEAISVWHETRNAALKTIDTPDYLGPSSKAIYLFVRNRLGVPFFGEEYLNAVEMSEKKIPTSGSEDMPHVHQTMGEMITAVYMALRSGSLFADVVPVLFDAAAAAEGAASADIRLPSKL